MIQALIVVALTLLAAPSVASASCPRGWTIAKRLTNADLYAVSALPGGAWAVGSVWGSDAVEHAVIMRADGSRWSELPAPSNDVLARAHPDISQEGASVALTGVFARAASDVWAVGRISDETGMTYGVVLHWDGTAWRHMPTPGRWVRLADVVALGRDDVWAVGSYEQQSQGDPVQPVAVHWDGHNWTRAAGTDVVGGEGQLSSAARAPGSRALWAVGGWGAPVDEFGALVMRHGVGAWTQRFLPSGTFLNGVSAVAWNDVWAVGDHDRLQTDGSAGVLHWNGGRWSVVPTPSEPGRWHDLLAVSAVTPTNVWAVGRKDGAGRREPLIEHWDGSSWSVVSAPTGIDRGLLDVAMRRSGYGWAVGVNHGGDHPRGGVIIRHCPT